MALIGKIRKNSSLIVIIVGIGVILFLVEKELFNLITVGSKANPRVGKVGSKDITLKQFQTSVEQLQNNFLAYNKRTPSNAETAHIRDEAWKQLVEDVIYEQLFATLGIQVSEDELVDMVQGDHIHPYLRHTFIEPQTQEFDKKQLLNYLQTLSQMSPEHQANWHRVEKFLAANRCRQKFYQLMKNSCFVTTLEAQQKYVLENATADVKYVFVPYSQIPADQELITDAMLKAYFKANKHNYQVEECRKIAYVKFAMQPTEADISSFQEELQTIKQSFVQAKEDSVFASIYTDAEPTSVYRTFALEELPQGLLQQKDKLKKGAVLGPLVEGTWHKLYKIVAVQDKQDKQYEVAIIAKSLLPGQEAREQAFRTANEWARAITDAKHFETYAVQKKLFVYHAQLGKNKDKIKEFAHARELMEWLYNQSKVGQISPVFELDDSYVVAIVVDHTKPGTASFEQVRAELIEQLLNEQKAQVVQAAWNIAADEPLETVATAYGYGAKVFTATQVKFSQSSLPGVGMAAKTIAKAFALQAQERSEPIAEKQGVCMLELIERHEKAMPPQLDHYQQDLLQLEQFKQEFYIPKSLEKLANTQDLRYKYY
jgi:peptidyl-prolyl cis-trans isomerase D